MIDIAGGARQRGHAQAQGAFGAEDAGMMGEFPAPPMGGAAVDAVGVIAFKLAPGTLLLEHAIQHGIDDLNRMTFIRHAGARHHGDRGATGYAEKSIHPDRCYAPPIASVAMKLRLAAAT